MRVRTLSDAEIDAMYTRLENANKAAQALKDSWIDFPITESEEVVIRFDNHQSISGDHKFIHFGKLRLVVV